MTTLDLQAYIRQYITANGEGAITGAVLQDVLLKMAETPTSLDILCPEKGAHQYNSLGEMLAALRISRAQLEGLMEGKYTAVNTSYTTNLGETQAVLPVQCIEKRGNSFDSILIGYYDIDLGGCFIEILINGESCIVMVNHLD